eukprot:Opistho-2@4423
MAAAAKFIASCLCQQTQVEMDTPPRWSVTCHCSQCRRALGGPATLVGYNPGDIKIIKGEYNLVSYATGKEERLSCRICSGKVFARLNHLNQWAVYLDTFLNPNHGPDGKLDPRFKPTAHIFYTSGIIDYKDGLPKFINLPKDFGGSGETVPEDYHSTRQ